MLSHPPATIGVGGQVCDKVDTRRQPISSSSCRGFRPRKRAGPTSSPEGGPMVSRARAAEEWSTTTSPRGGALPARILSLEGFPDRGHGHGGDDDLSSPALGQARAHRALPLAPVALTRLKSVKTGNKRTYRLIMDLRLIYYDAVCPGLLGRKRRRLEHGMPINQTKEAVARQPMRPRVSGVE
jgi:hypothetical protein